MFSKLLFLFVSGWTTGDEEGSEIGKAFFLNKSIGDGGDVLFDEGRGGGSFLVKIFHFFGCTPNLCFILQK